MSDYLNPELTKDLIAQTLSTFDSLTKEKLARLRAYEIARSPFSIVSDSATVAVACLFSAIGGVVTVLMYSIGLPLIPWAFSVVGAAGIVGMAAVVGFILKACVVGPERYGSFVDDMTKTEKIMLLEARDIPVLRDHLSCVKQAGRYLTRAEGNLILSYVARVRREKEEAEILV